MTGNAVQECAAQSDDRSAERPEFRDHAALYLELTDAGREGHRAGDWIQMNSGIAFWPLDPRADEVRIEDIAHSLSMLCRFGGHCDQFYSVAEHSVHVARLVSPEAALWGLLHDASEAYVVDLPRPLKRMLPGYALIERKVHLAIAEHFGLPPEIPAEVKAADTAMLLAEARQIMRVPPMPWVESGEPLNLTLRCWPPERAREEFMIEFRRLSTREQPKQPRPCAIRLPPRSLTDVDARARTSRPTRLLWAWA